MKLSEMRDEPGAIRGLRPGAGAAFVSASIRVPGHLGVLVAAIGWLAAGTGVGAELWQRRFDFREEWTVREWEPWHDLAPLRATAEGMELRITGGDPYCGGPRLGLPGILPVWLELRLWSEQGGTAQIFHFRDQPREEDSVRFDVPAGQWYEARLPLPPLSPDTRLRFDPPGTGGRCVLEHLTVIERRVPQPPAWPVPAEPQLAAPVVEISAGRMALRHGRAGPGDFDLQVGGVRMARGHPHAWLGYQRGDAVRWISWDGRGGPSQSGGSGSSAATGGAEVWMESGRTVRVRARLRDPDGGQWTLEQAFQGSDEGSFRVVVRVGCDQDREVLHLPLFWLVAGPGDAGTNKQQALFAGLEYLEDEPSSSTADLLPPASNRQVPDTAKLTLPLSVLVARDRYVGVLWERAGDEVAAVFDSPDRLFRSGGHLMGWIFPGSDGRLRDESNLLPHGPVRLAAGQTLEWRGWILGGEGSTVVPAVQHALRLMGWPALPDPGLSARDYFRLAARGWLDSDIRQGDLFRHAVWPGFGPQPAADAAWTMLWLAGRVEDPALARRLIETARAAVARVPAGRRNQQQVGHIRWPVPALVFGDGLAEARSAAELARAALGEFEPDGSLLYKPRPGGPDFARTHFSREASGFMAERVAAVLEAALWTGEPDLIAAGLEKLEVLDRKFQNGVPRGAQTWEIPLHTPDILAAAHLVRAFVRGYELTGEQRWLDRARYWAWTGVPFVYLTRPVPGPVGLYATIPVLGATGWRAPVWLGRPVQWCGLVYADALWELAEHDPQGPWARLARGISWSGVQQTWPADDRARGGLLPDFYLLREQRRDGPAINPATVLLPAIRAYEAPLAYSRCVVRSAGLRLHVPGTVRVEVNEADHLVLRVEPWPKEPCWILINGCQRLPEVRRDGVPVEVRWGRDFEESGGRLVVRVQGPTRIELRHWR
ncbi:hypothetical protein G4L39_01520 [Limisphaera ngatamarikiensis]|uniref:Uncharacterized protein n=1 Tax=Limisphaera ngatamarikiensis TaxID=1324935 RepID=A0A6M1RKQ4_9BACT|nr:hypothetical protein [Limisphaera ngatamarikiensis]NGO38077.1 hypothetical protein [Limisphaera ngatamarikiensis]